MQEYHVLRYGAYFRNWCVAFGEHDSIVNKTTGATWLVAEHQIGFLLQPDIIRILQQELLRQPKTPSLSSEGGRIQLGTHQYTLTDEADWESYHALSQLLGKGPCHLYLTSHFKYGTKARILTLSNSEPVYILYKKIGDFVIHLD